jgi:hypothetical protein
MIHFDTVITFVGNERRTVDADLFFATFEELVDLYKCRGLSGDALDYAVRDALPARLLELVGNGGKPN